MPNDSYPHKNGLFQLKNLSYLLAIQAEKEMRATGSVETLCPKCGKRPVVELGPYRLKVRCACGFVYNGEIYD